MGLESALNSKLTSIQVCETQSHFIHAYKTFVDAWTLQKTAKWMGGKGAMKQPIRVFSHQTSPWLEVLGLFVFVFGGLPNVTFTP